MDYLYGNLLESVQDINYYGSDSETAKVTVDNKTRQIAVDVKNLPHDMLSIKTPEKNGRYILRGTVVDGVITYEWIDESKYFSTNPVASNTTIAGGHMKPNNLVTGEDCLCR